MCVHGWLPRVQQDQLAAIFLLLRENQEALGEVTEGDMEEQLKLYSLWGRGGEASSPWQHKPSLPVFQFYDFNLEYDLRRFDVSTFLSKYFWNNCWNILKRFSEILLKLKLFLMFFSNFVWNVNVFHCFLLFKRIILETFAQQDCG